MAIDRERALGKLELPFCCGIEVVSVDRLRNYSKGPTLKQLAYVFYKKFIEDYLWQEEDEEVDESCAGFIFTDIKQNLNKPINQLLTEIVKPIKVGVNGTTENTIYMWVVKKERIKKLYNQFYGKKRKSSSKKGR